MVSRTTDDYERLALADCVAISEPAFWAGYDRSDAEGFRDYFRQLTETEPRRAAMYGIDHYAWLCINPKEAEDVGLSKDVIAIIPEFIDKPNILGIGEIGLNKITKNEIAVFQQQLDLAIRYNQIVLVHTPHLEDKLKGTKFILDMVREAKAGPGRVLIDHVEEHTIKIALDRGHWAGMTLYPNSKTSIARAADMIERFGGDRLMVNSAADWGVSDALAVPKFRLEMKLRGHPRAAADRVTFANPIRFFQQSPKFVVRPEWQSWLAS
jgi:predicted metal-dependent TIM-barrel fold hydrolase